MDTAADSFRKIEPVVKQRASGGYLAVSAPGSTISLGVEGATEQEARTLFYKEREAWAPLAARPRHFANPS